MQRICLDTSAYSQLRRGHRECARILAGAAWLGVPAIVIGELWEGFSRGSRKQENERELSAFLSEPVVEVIPVDLSVGQIYADLLSDLRKKRTPIPTNDVWIAATAVREGASLVTFDRHFQSIPRLSVLPLI